VALGLKHFIKPMEAKEDFRAGEYLLLLTDISMEGMGGYDLYNKLHDIDNNLKVCFLTGHPKYSTGFRTFFPTMDEKCFVTKPINFSQLADRILSIIDTK
jgi:FixJ family two-component response regulator